MALLRRRLTLQVRRDSIARSESADSAQNPCTLPLFGEIATARPRFFLSSCPARFLCSPEVKMRSPGLMLSVCAVLLSPSVGFFSGGPAFTRRVASTTSWGRLSVEGMFAGAQRMHVRFLDPPVLCRGQHPS